ncbi:MAG TPA: SPOR domain-containing protein [Gallionella sp.]|nr:SPOR domain-containing protein [Gallionella sp.]
MAIQQTDEELNLRRKARRRLIGAIALTLAVVVILPMVLDSEPKPAAQDIDLRIPSPDKVGAFVPGVPTAELAEAAPAAASAVATSATPAAVSAVPAAPAVAPAGNTSLPASAVAPAAPANNSTAAPVKAPTAAETAPESKVTDKAAAGETFAAQVGAYSNAETAKQEMLKLKKWGFKAYTEKNGEKVRVRVGPYTDRAKVDKVCQLLEKHGLKAVIVSAQ